MSMKEMMNLEYDKDNPRRMTKEGWWLRIVGGGIVLVLSIVLSVVFVINSLQLWWYRAWGLTPQILIMVIVAVFVGGVIWCYVAGLRELIRTRRDGTLLIVDDKSDDEDSATEEEIAQAITGVIPAVRNNADDSSIDINRETVSEVDSIIKEKSESSSE